MKLNTMSVRRLMILPKMLCKGSLAGERTLMVPRQSLCIVWGMEHGAMGKRWSVTPCLQHMCATSSNSAADREEVAQ